MYKARKVRDADIDAFHQAHSSLRAITGLLMTGNANNMHLVHPDNLCSLLSMIADQMEDAFPEYEQEPCIGDNK